MIQKFWAWIKKVVAWAVNKFFAFTSNPYTRVQWDHFSIAYIVFVTTYLFFGNLWICAGTGVPFVAFKELWVDPRAEHGGTIGKPDWDDLAFYLAGVLVVRLILLLPHHR